MQPGTIDSHALELLRKIERDHGREAFCGGYVKIARLVQLCTETAKATLEHSSTELITYVLGAIEFALRMEIWKVSDMTVTALDKTRDGTPGYVLLILARRQVLRRFGLLMDDLRANDMAKSVVEDLDALLQHTRNYGTYEHAFPASEGGDSVKTYKNKHTKTKTGQIATDFVYDLLGGAHDDVLLAAIKANATTIKDMNWATIDLAPLKEVSRHLNLQRAVGLNAGGAPPASSRALQRYASDCSNNEEDRATSMKERAEVVTNNNTTLILVTCVCKGFWHNLAMPCCLCSLCLSWIASSPWPCQSSW